ncbi:MAG: hypothetical protein ACFFD2_21230 [Promethearchaeota archaeon]
MELKVREGDLLENHEGLIFDVKGLIHPPERIIAFLRYYPDPSGNRIRAGIRYKKIYSLEERYKFLNDRYPQYLFHDKTSGEMLQGILIEDIKKIYKPEELMKKLLQKGENGQGKSSLIIEKALEMVKLIQNQSNINFDKIGLTGSCLVNLEIEQSDIDKIIYGIKNAYLIKEALITLYKSHKETICPYSHENIINLYEFRGKESNLNFQEFVKIEQRKKLQGIFKGKEYYIRCIKDWNEINGQNIQYKPLGIGIARGLVVNDEEAILTPCRYLIENSEVIDGMKISEPIREIVSFRGRFCEQAQKGENIEARGKVEKVISDREIYLRLLLGTYKEDYFRILNR